MVVLGSPMAKESHLLAVARQFGLDEDCFEFCLSYEKAKTYPYQKLKNTEKYEAVIVGPIPHSTRGKGSYSSAIAAMESDASYPPVYRVEKITRASFRTVLSRIAEKEYAAA